MVQVVHALLGKHVDVFTKETQRLFMYGFESREKQQLLIAVGPMSLHKSALRDEFVAYARRNIAPITNFQKQTHLAFLEGQVRQLLTKSCETMEGGVLRKMIKYAGKYKLMKADALAKKLPLRDSAHKVLEVEDV